ncbi:unnamed protein product [Phytophthora fragariaefolia]|uniref:Unnamed protein product n=1 Tax=Phytophthora fragariaefolia TaxID=1490495 RepID=A0A9W6Y0W9_9STRA|nr:unnamed protein product [Phytophthora fragariaefolia]
MLASKVDRLLQGVAARGAQPLSLPGKVQPVNNVVAFSGGVDSSLAAALVFRVFPSSSAACIGRSAALPSVQLQQARQVATHIGVPLWECRTEEAKEDGYVANQGKSCYLCKTTLYSTLNQVAEFAWQELQLQMGTSSGEMGQKMKPVLYNGTNADDQLDPTRVGNGESAEWTYQARGAGRGQVFGASQLERGGVAVFEIEVAIWSGSDAGDTMGFAMVTFFLEMMLRDCFLQEHLHRVEKAEDFVRGLIHLEPQMNMRVRFLAGNKAAVGESRYFLCCYKWADNGSVDAELDNDALEMAMPELEVIDAELRRLGIY